MLRKLVPIVLVIVTVVGLPVMVAFADTIFLPLVARAGGVLGELVRVEDNMVASDGVFVTFKTSGGNIGILDTTNNSWWVAEVEQAPSGWVSLVWPEVANLEWVGGKLLIRSDSGRFLCSYDPGERRCVYPEFLPWPHPTPWPTPTDIFPTPAPTPTDIWPTPGPTPTPVHN